MSEAWTSVALGDVLTKSDSLVDIKPEGKYREVTVRLWGKGVTQRREISGAEITSSRRFVVRTNQFIMSRIDARNGAFGLIPESLNDAVVSNDFPVFTPNAKRILPAFLNWISKTRSFVDLCKAASEGTTNRVRLKESKFLSTKISLPPLDEQRRIVRRIDELAAKIEEARELRRQSVREVSTVTEAQTSAMFDTLTTYPQVAIKLLGENGDNPIQIGPFGAQLHREEFAESGVPVLNVGNVTNNGLDVKRLDHVMPEKARSLSRYTIKTNDLLFARSGATLGKVCLVPQGCDDWLMTGHLFRVRFDAERCLPEFAYAALRSARGVRAQVFGQVRGATRPGFNTTLLGQVKLPLPPVKEQKYIVVHLEKLQTKVNTLSNMQSETAAELDALLPSVLDKAFKGEL